MAEASVTRSIINSMVDYMMKCPFLKDGAFRMDAIGDEATEYSINIGTFAPVIETYIDGSSDRRYVLEFNSREEYDLDRQQNIANSTFYEDLADWIDEQNAAGNLPVMPKGCHPETIQALSSGFLFNEEGETARYQIQIELTYHKDA